MNKNQYNFRLNNMQRQFKRKMLSGEDGQQEKQISERTGGYGKDGTVSIIKLDTINLSECLAKKAISDYHQNRFKTARK